MASAVNNSCDPKVIQQFVNDIERLESEMDSKKGEYMAWCQRQRTLINDYIERAKDAGAPKRDFKAVLKARKLERKIKNLRDDLEDGGDTYDMIREALGDYADLPLGAAAVDKAEKKRASAAAINALAGDDMAAENAKNLKGGIKQLQ